MTGDEPEAARRQRPMPSFGVTFAKASTTVSADFITALELLFSTALAKVDPRVTPPQYTQYAIPAYVMAAAAVESFVNEMFLSGFAKMALGDTVVDDVPELERLDLLAKIVVVPQLIFGKTLARGEQPYSDMVILAKLRNEVAHYKMKYKPPSFVRTLAQRGIAVRVPPEQEDGGPHPWANRVSTIQGIMWAHDTMCATARALVSLAPETARSTLAIAQNFGEDHGHRMREQAKARGITV
jgi:hypothetical protein